ncbi:MAG: SDR family NAD(P)-dependent oxidoreductase [Phycisphaerales bacterium]|nr:SDR family NAD(P)-dependent oxidoreductase [Phycisphaerales bacterium]
MAIDLHGKVLVVTGGGTGIGAETALAAAEAGMKVCLCGRRMPPLEETVARIEQAGGQAIAVKLDVTDQESESHLLDTAEKELGPVWAVFANAGRGLNRYVNETSDAEMKALFEVNFFATHRLLAESARRMLAHGQGGHLLACASCLSRFAIPKHGGYAATKASQDMLCQAMRLELKPHGIHVSSVHPITTRTEFFEVAAEHSGNSDYKVIDDAPKLFIQSSRRVANAVIRCLRRPRPEVWTSRIVRMATAIRCVFPTLFDRKVKDTAR